MKYIIPLILLTVFACNVIDNKKDNESSDQLKIKNCKVYSADFGLLDESSPGLLMQEFRFNEDGFVRELLRFDSDGIMTGKFEISGEDSPFPLPDKPEFKDTTIIKTEYGTMGDLRKREVKKFNKNGLLIEVLLYNSADSLKQKNTYTYNPEGFVSKDMYWDVELNIPIQVINYLYEFHTK